MADLEQVVTEDQRKSMVLVGKKPTMNYVLAVVTQFNGGAKSITIKARGNAISKAVDVAEIVRSRFLPELKDPSKKELKIATEEITNEDGSTSKVSSIRLLLSAGDEKAEEPGKENIVLVGKKPTMNYVLAVVTQFNGGAKEVSVKARGNSISKAVDVSEIARNRFVSSVKSPSTECIRINSEELTNEDGSTSKVSSIAITLER